MDAFRSVPGGSHHPMSPQPVCPGVCLKGRALWGQTQSSNKAVGAPVKSVGAQSLAVGNAGGGGIGVADVPSGRVEEGALGGGGGAPPLPSSKALRVPQASRLPMHVLWSAHHSWGFAADVPLVSARPDTLRHGWVPLSHVLNAAGSYSVLHVSEASITEWYILWG